MSRDTRSVGLAFLLSILLVAGIALACNILLTTQTSTMACQQHYTLACLL